MSNFNWLDPNVVTGYGSLALGVLVLYAFRSYAVVWRRKTATPHLGAAIWWLVMRSVCRSIWWDFFQGFDLGNSSNWMWNLMGIYACWHGLRGFYLALPAKYRKRYNILTAPFYPKRLENLFFLRGGKDDKGI